MPNVPEIAPPVLLTMAPPALLPTNRAPLLTKMPALPAEIVPLLVTPPVKVETPRAEMPLAIAAEIVPALTMPPPALEEPNWAALVMRMPLFAEIVPPVPLVMAPAKVCGSAMRMPVKAAEIAPLLEIPPANVDPPRT